MPGSPETSPTDSSRANSPPSASNVSVTPESDLRGRHIKSAAEAYRAFGVRQVLTGEVRRGPQTQVDLRLIDAGSEKITGSASVTSSGPDLDESVLREASALIGLPRDPLDAARLRVNAKTATAERLA